MSKGCGQSNQILTVSHLAVFKLASDQFPDEDLRFSCHFPAGIIGGLSLLESASLVALLKIINPTQVFEFGTYLGATSVLIASNVDQAMVTTLDLEPEKIAVANREALDKKDKDENDDYLRALYQELGPRYISRAPKDVRDRIHPIQCDSTTLNTQQLGYVDRFEFIFIDGGHDQDIIKSDTEKAFTMAKPDSVIVWHDYTSGVHTDVTHYLAEVCELRPIYHLQHTMLAIHPMGRYVELFAQLLKEPLSC